jgi:hypothetical protein
MQIDVLDDDDVPMRAILESLYEISVHENNQFISFRSSDIPEGSIAIRIAKRTTEAIHGPG